MDDRIDVLYAVSVAGHYDMGMVRVFVAVHETLSVTAAAERLYLTQPSVSYTLGKLRRLFGDPLFVRRGHRLVPTRRADVLYPRLKELLEGLDSAMGATESFDPATTGRTFTIMLSDVGVTGLLPRVVAAMGQQSPAARLKVGALRVLQAVDALRMGTVDAVVCTPPLEGDDLMRDFLFKQPYLGICRVDHPRIGRRPTLAEYEAEKHVAVAPTTGHGVLAESVREHGVLREVALTLPSFTGIASVLAITDYLGFAPQNYAERFASRNEMRAFELPFPVPESVVSLYTMRRGIPSPEVEWFRSLVQLTLGDADARTIAG
jgi:DNA-binding transcriptional LysR family regulator